MNRRDFQKHNRHSTFSTGLVLLTCIPQRGVASLHCHPRSVAAGKPAGSPSDAEELGGRCWMAPGVTGRFEVEERQGTVSAELDPSETPRTVAPKPVDLVSGIRTRMEHSHPGKPYIARSVNAHRLRARWLIGLHTRNRPRRNPDETQVPLARTIGWGGGLLRSVVCCCLEQMGAGTAQARQPSRHGRRRRGSMSRFCGSSRQEATRRCCGRVVRYRYERLYGSSDGVGRIRVGRGRQRTGLTTRTPASSEHPSIMVGEPDLHQWRVDAMTIPPRETVAERRLSGSIRVDEVTMLAAADELQPATMDGTM
jgi:hypothetical protein